MLKESPDAAKYPSAARWWKHIASYEAEFATLPGDASKPYTVYGPEDVAATLNPANAPAAAEKEEEEDDDVDLFGSDDDEEEDAEVVHIREERLAAYREKKAAKPKVAAKSVVIMDVKPWGAYLYSYSYPRSHACILEADHPGPADDETDMNALEESVRSIEKDGLVWGASKLVPIGYGVRKLQISLVVEDEKISLDELQEEIAGFDDYVQSSDIVSSLPKNVCIKVNRLLTMSTPGYYAKVVNCLWSRVSHLAPASIHGMIYGS